MTHYEILEVSETASEEVIRMAYKALAKKYHPDVYIGDPEIAHHKMKQINEAYRILSDFEKRKAYDELIKKCKQDNHNNAQSGFENNQSFNSKPSSKDYAQRSSASIRSAVIIAVCLFINFSQVLHPYIEGKGIYDNALLYGLHEFACVSLFCMIVPIGISVYKEYQLPKEIKKICVINSVAVWLVSLGLYVTEVTSAMSIGWIVAVLYYFVNKHIICQIHIHNQSTNKTGLRIWFCVIVFVLVAAIIGGMADK